MFPAAAVMHEFVGPHYLYLAVFAAFFGTRFAFQYLGMRMMAKFGKP